MDEPDLGRVIRTSVVDPQGNDAGDHAAIILTTKAEFAAGKPIKAVVVSSKLDYVNSDSMVLLPFVKPPGQHPQTGFNKRCAAIGHWIIEVEESEIRKYGKRIYGSLLKEVLECVQRVAAAKTTPPTSTQS